MQFDQNHINESPHPVVIVDFNDTPLYAYNYEVELKDVFNSSGYGIGSTITKIPALRIDYILHDKILKVLIIKKSIKNYPSFRYLLH